jgi:HEPN domain-containing protein
LLLHYGYGADLPRIHELARLITLLEYQGESVLENVREAARPSGYAVEARYPGLSEPVSFEEYREALTLAEEAVRWTEERL